MTIDVPRPAWETELGLRVAADHDLAAPEPRFSAKDHGEIWSSARWAAVAADIQEDTNMSDGDLWFTASLKDVEDNLGYAEHLLDNLDEMAAETASTWQTIRECGDHWSIVDAAQANWAWEDRHHHDDHDADGS